MIAGLPSSDLAGAAAALSALALDVVGIEGKVTDAAHLRALVDTAV